MNLRNGYSYSKKKLFKNLLIVFTICLTLIVEANIFYMGFNTTPKKSDVIIVLGCSVWDKVPSPTLKQRIYKAYELYKKGYADRIIATGAKGYGENNYEATVIKNWLENLGVPGSKIIEEKEATNTVENLNFSKNIMRRNGFNSAIIVTNYYHIYRSSMIANDLKMIVSFGKTEMPASKINLVTSNLREIISVMKYFTLQTFSKLRG